MDNLAYSVSRVFDATVQDLWACWTDPVQLENWYSPTDLTVVPGSAVSQLVVGGLWAIAVDASSYGHIAYFYGTYSEIRPLEKIVHSLHYTQSLREFELKDMDSESHQIHITFEPDSDGVKVEFAQYGEMDPDQAKMAQAGMTSYFDNLERHLGL